MIRCILSVFSFEANEKITVGRNLLGRMSGDQDHKHPLASPILDHSHPPDVVHPPEKVGAVDCLHDLDPPALA